MHQDVFEILFVPVLWGVCAGGAVAAAFLAVLVGLDVLITGLIRAGQFEGESQIRLVDDPQARLARWLEDEGSSSPGLHL
jgi:hypothetical protein